MGSVDTSLATTNLQSFVTAVNDARNLLNQKLLGIPYRKCG